MCHRVAQPTWRQRLSQPPESVGCPWLSYQWILSIPDTRSKWLSRLTMGKGFLQRLSNAARIVEFRHSSMQQLQDPFPVLRVELAEFGRASRMYFSTHAAARSPMGTKRSFLPLPLAHQQRAALAFQIEQSQPEFLKISQVPRPRFSRGSLRMRTAGIVPP
jgi:hypothetical protein